MPQFFVDLNGGEKFCTINGNDFVHLTKVRRARVGDRLHLRNRSGMQFVGKIVEIFDSFLRVEIIEKKTHVPDSVQITLGIAILKGWKFEFVIQKAVEIGISRIVPLITERSVPHINEKELKKMDRWNKIILEASKQCMRHNIPEITNIYKFDEFVNKSIDGVKIIAHPYCNAIELKDLVKEISAKMCTILVGPEGGFSEREICAAEKAGWRAVKFGQNCMRAETAAIVLPAIILYEWSGYV